MNPIFLDLGFIKIYWYSLFIFMALIVGGTVVFNESKKFEVPENFVTNLFFWTIPVALIGARLYYVVFNLSYYLKNPLDILKVWEGGLAIHGGVIAGLLFIISYCKRYSISYKYMIDFCAPGLLIGQAIGRWGNFFNSEAHGGPTTYEFLKSIFVPEFVIDGMKINEFYYQPTFYYESLWCLVGFIIIILIRKLKYLKLNQITSFYLIWYGLTRVVMEPLRSGGYEYSQSFITAIVMMGAGALGILAFHIYDLIRKKKGLKPRTLETIFKNEEEETDSL